MKTRIVITLLVVLGAYFIDNALFHPVETLVKNNVAIATVNGGDSAWVLQQAAQTSLSGTHAAFYIGYLVALTAIWWTPVCKCLMDSDQSTEQ